MQKIIKLSQIQCLRNNAGLLFYSSVGQKYNMDFIKAKLLVGLPIFLKAVGENSSDCLFQLFHTDTLLAS